MASKKDLYPPVGFHFKVEFKLAGVSGQHREARFQEVTGFKKDLAVEEYKEGGENRFSHRFPAPAKYTNLILKRGVLLKSKVVDWCFEAIDHFTFEPIDVFVTLLNEKHADLISWQFVGAYPLKWSTGDLKAQDNVILVETMELAYRYFTKKDV
jgi:phage tail-like protein